MSVKEKIKSVVGIICTILVVVLVGLIVKNNDFMPGFIFWIVAEIAVFADGIAVYNMIVF